MTERSGDFLKTQHDLEGTQEVVVEALGRLVGDTNVRLCDASRRYTVGDINAAALTYGQIVARIPSEQSPDLPVGAQRCEDPLTEALLQKNHLAHIDAYLTVDYREQRGRQSVPNTNPIELGGFEAVELQKRYPEEFARLLHPVVEGYSWYRGYEVVIGETESALLFQPWMFPGREGGSPFPILYTVGNPTPAVLQTIAAEFGLEKVS